MFSKISEIFSFKDCTYGLDTYKVGSARGQAFSLIKEPNVFTIETSFFGYIKNEEKVHFTPEILFTLGQEFGNSVYLYNAKEDKELYDFTFEEIKE